MPIYEYVCNECGTEFERMVRLSEADHKQECPRCGSDQTHKQISTFASHFAGASLGSASSSSGSSCSSGRSPFR